MELRGDLERWGLIHCTTSWNSLPRTFHFLQFLSLLCTSEHGLQTWSRTWTLIDGIPRVLWVTRLCREVRRVQMTVGVHPLFSGVQCVSLWTIPTRPVRSRGSRTPNGLGAHEAQKSRTLIERQSTQFENDSVMGLARWSLAGQEETRQRGYIASTALQLSRMCVYPSAYTYTYR